MNLSLFCSHHVLIIAISHAIKPFELLPTMLDLFLEKEILHGFTVIKDLITPVKNPTSFLNEEI